MAAVSAGSASRAMGKCRTRIVGEGDVANVNRLGEVVLMLDVRVKGSSRAAVTLGPVSRENEGGVSFPTRGMSRGWLVVMVSLEMDIRRG